MTNIGALSLRGTQYSAAIPKSQVKNTLQSTDETIKVDQDSRDKKILEKKIRTAQNVEGVCWLGAFAGVGFGVITNIPHM